MPRKNLWNANLPRVELDQRVRDARLRLERIERLLVPRAAVTNFGRVSTALRFISRSMSIARISAAAAGHTLEDEGIEESRSPTADAGIVLAEHAI